MTLRCARCGIGHRQPGSLCDWCAAPARARFPFRTAGRRWLRRSTLAARLWRRGPIVTGMSAGIIVHELATAAGVTLGLPGLWQTGFFWSRQWWWVLLPDPWQPWLFAAARGAAYGALAGLVAARRGQAPGSRGGRRSSRQFLPPSPAMAAALVALLASLADAQTGLDYCLTAALLAAAAGRLTTLLMMGRATATAGGEA